MIFLANLQTESTRQRWRSSSAIVNQEIVIKADIIKEIDTIAILGHNLTDDAIILIQANTVNDWTIPPVNLSATVDPETENIIVCNDGLGAAYEFLKITIIDPANPCGYVEIGRIVAGMALTLTKDEDITDNISINSEDLSEKMQTFGYFRQSNENIIARSFSCSFEKLSTKVDENENYKNLKKFIKYVKTVMPFIVIVDRGDPNFFNMHCQLNKLPSYSYTINGYVSFGLDMEEQF